MRVFLAGAAGAIGRRLVPLLLEAGHDVTGTTRRPERAQELRAAGVTPAVVDFYDAGAVREALAAARPDVVLHQLTDLPQTFDPATFPEALARNARLRREGTANLVAAAVPAGARRLVAQSISFVYAPGATPHDEDDPLGEESAAGVVELERLVRDAPLEGLVLRYGLLYGPGTWYDVPTGESTVHVDAAAHAALLALTTGAPGVYNVADDGGSAANAKARRELGWDPGFRLRSP